MHRAVYAVRFQDKRLLETKILFLSLSSTLDSDMFCNPSHYDPWSWLNVHRASMRLALR
jgi:hypothetical protein